MQKNFDAIIIGAGAAGLFLRGACYRMSHEAALFDVLLQTLFCANIACVLEIILAL